MRLALVVLAGFDSHILSGKFAVNHTHQNRRIIPGQLFRVDVILRGLFGYSFSVTVRLLLIVLIGNLQRHGAGVSAQHNAVVGDNRRAVDGVRVVVHQIARVKLHGIAQNLFLLTGIGMVGPFLYAFRVIAAPGKTIRRVVRRNQRGCFPYFIPGVLAAFLAHQ